MNEVLQFGDSVIGIDEIGNFSESVAGMSVGDSYYMGWREGRDEEKVDIEDEEWDL